MSSGINWKYRVSNADPDQPPISYSVGHSWASCARNELIVGLVFGLNAVRTAYADLPGLGYHRQLWLKAKMSGAKHIANIASRYILDVSARRMGKRSPLAHGGCNIETRSVEEWMHDSQFVCGREIAEYAGVTLGSPFLSNWEKLALAAEEWPSMKWGICPKVTTLKVETWEGGREVNADEATRVLDAAEAWGRAVDTWAASTEAGIGLGNLLDEEVVKAAINVTRKTGSVAALRHALRVCRYIQ